jgi:N-acetylmuramoyl-L-alanine amidase
MRLTLRLIAVAALVVFATGIAGGASPNLVSGMRIVGDANRTRFVVDLAKSPDYHLLRLANPNRLVIDMPNVNFSEEAKPGEGRGLISDYRYGLIAPGKGRVVLDLAGPVEIVNSFVLDPVGTEPARFVVDMAPTSGDAFMTAALQDLPPRAPALRGAEPSAPAMSSGLPVVVIDPGHGGIDSGAVGKDGTLEKDITLAFSLELARQLKAGGKIEPVLTRTDDTFLSLANRVQVARDHKALLFVSVHADTVREDYVRGATVYTLSDEASDTLSQALAEHENRSDILAGLALDDQPDDVADILFDLARRETKNLSVRFAKSLVSDMRGKVMLNSNPWRRAAFRVLKAPDVPSVLFELGYLSSPDDEKLFASDAWPSGEARSVARAIEAYLGERQAAAGQ